MPSIRSVADKEIVSGSFICAEGEVCLLREFIGEAEVVLKISVQKTADHANYSWVTSSNEVMVTFNASEFDLNTQVELNPLHLNPTGSHSLRVSIANSGPSNLYFIHAQIQFTKYQGGKSES